LMSYLDFDNSDRKKKKKRFAIGVVIWILSIMTIIGLGYLTVRISIVKVVVSGGSMERTLSDNDKIMVEMLSYRFGEPKRFDIIAYKQGGREHVYYGIKRIIGLPHEVVQIMNGHVYIDGKLLAEPMNVEPINIPGLAEQPITLDENEYFVLGDARNQSEDSRFANIGNIVRDDIIGKAFLRTSPSVTIISKENLKKDTME